MHYKEKKVVFIVQMVCDRFLLLLGKLIGLRARPPAETKILESLRLDWKKEKKPKPNDDDDDDFQKFIQPWDCVSFDPSILYDCRGRIHM